MSNAYDIAAFRSKIGTIKVEDNATLLKQMAEEAEKRYLEQEGAEKK